mmetsp:Transcript_32837/g.48904  ORF Transcript_32837/g.48904 Transcript_32837/m.48904 type:complete len:136 (+) Transcript_32837:1142-1549(+)
MRECCYFEVYNTVSTSFECSDKWKQVMYIFAKTEKTFESIFMINMLQFWNRDSAFHPFPPYSRRCVIMSYYIGEQMEANNAPNLCTCDKVNFLCPNRIGLYLYTRNHFEEMLEANVKQNASLGSFEQNLSCFSIH